MLLDSDGCFRRPRSASDRLWSTRCCRSLRDDEGQ